MTTAFILIILAAVLCYLVIPLFDYVYRFFAQKKIRIFFKITRQYPDWGDKKNLADRRNSAAGRFYGFFEAYEAPGLLWLRNGPRSVAVKYQDAAVCCLTQKKDPSRDYFVLRKISWSKVSSLETGLRIYAAGRVLSENGAVTFLGTDEIPLLIILDDTKEGGNFDDAVIEGSFSGGQGEESLVTLLSLFSGMTAIFFLLVWQLENYNSTFSIITSLILLCAPGLPYIPPGIIFTFVYRMLRARAVKTPAVRRMDNSARFLDVFPPETILSLTMLFLAAAVNAVFAFLVLLALFF